MCTQIFTPIKIPCIIVSREFDACDLQADMQEFLDQKIPEQFRIKKAENQKPSAQANTTQITPKFQLLTRDNESKSFKVFENLKDSEIPA